MNHDLRKPPVWKTIFPLNHLIANWRVFRSFMLINVDLADLKLRWLPFLMRFVSIHYLYLGNNRLRRLPKWFKKQKKLQFIDLAQNRFERFPSVLCNLTSLNSLYIGANNIKEIPKEILNLSKLEILSVPSCNLDTLPKFICTIPNLRTLDISQNPKITEFPEEIGLMHNLYRLFFYDTSIETLPISILNIGLGKLPTSFISPQLRTAPAGWETFSYPKFDHAFSTLLMTKSLEKKVGIDSNQLIDTYRLRLAAAPAHQRNDYLASFWNTHFLSAIKQNATHVMVHGFSYTIDDLDLDWSLLKNSCVESLQLAACIGTKPPEEIGELVQLKNLEIDVYNDISGIPTTFGQLKNLKTFDFDTSRLTFKVDIPIDATAQEKIRLILEAQAGIN